MKRLNKTELFNFGIGDLGINLNFQLISFYLLYFYTEVVGISMVHAGFIVLIARIWDAINDPMMGYIADRSKNKFGTYKPFVFWGAIPLNLILIACFSVPELSETIKIVYCYFFYILHGMIFTAVGMSYNAMGTLVTQDQQERAKISTLRMFFAVPVVVTIVGAYVKPFVNSKPIIIELVGIELITLYGPQFATKSEGWFHIAVIFGIISTIALFHAGLLSKERVNEPIKKFNLKDFPKIILKNNPLIILSAAMFLNTAIWVIQNAVAAYYFKFVVGVESLQTIFFQWMLPAQILGVILTPILTEKFGKKNVFIIGSLIVFFVSIIRHFIPIPTTDSNTIFIALSMVGTTFMMFCSICQWGMVPDTIEYGQWKTGVRSEGMPLSFFSFMQKLAMSFGAFFAALVMAFTGFKEKELLQSEFALNGIAYLFNIIPGLFSLACLLTLFYYKLGVKEYDQILSELNSRS